MDNMDKLFVFLVYACAIGVPFALIGMVCEWYFEKRGKK
jgi:hypothetical protein